MNRSDHFGKTLISARRGWPIEGDAHRNRQATRFPSLPCVAALLVAGGLLVLTGCAATGEPAEDDATSRQALTTPYSAEVSNGTLVITGKSGTTQLALRLRAGVPNMLEVDVGDDGSADFSFDRGQFDRIVVEGGSGDDTIRIDEINGMFTDTELTTINGGRGNDTLLGGSGAETLDGGPGNDTIAGRRGADVVLMGDGDDTFVWNPGDGSDVLEGQAGTDTMVFHGANVGESFELSASGSRLRFFRDVGLVDLDVNGVERIDLDVRGGADSVVVKDLTGTGVAEVNVDLAALPGSTDADGQPDSVVVQGTLAADTIDISADAGRVVAHGLAAQVRVKGCEREDRLVFDGVGQDMVNVNGSEGADVMDVTFSSVPGYARVLATGFSASVDVSGALTLSVNGLGGPDTITGATGLSSLGIPMIIDGGRGDDTITGGGINLLLGGPGNDTFVWNPGGGSDVIDGQGGQDVLVFHGANVSENIALSANGPRLRFSRDVATVALDVNDVERVDVEAIGGADNVVVNDLSGTGVTLVNVDLAGILGGALGDSQSDAVTVNATTGTDRIDVSADADAVVVDGLAAQVRITHAEPTLDRLIVDTLGGGDTIRLGPGLDALISTTLNP